MSWLVDVDYPGANGCGVAVDVCEGAPAVSLTPDPRHGEWALWFRFRLRRIDADTPAPWLVLRHVPTLLGGRDGADLRPVISCDGGAWQRLGRGEPQRHTDGRCNARWRLPAAAAAMEVAFCYPYDLADLERMLGASQLRVQAVGASERGRPLLRVDNGPGVLGSQRPGLFVVARQHSGETPGSWVMDGLLRRIAELGEAAPLTWALPFGDHDGVVDGCYGKGRHPVDMNRSWPGAESGCRRHEVQCWIETFVHWRQRCAPRLVLDLHAPAGFENDGLFAYLRGNTAGVGSAATTLWAERIRTGVGSPWAAAANFARLTNPDSPTLNRWVDSSSGIPALTLETSYQGNGDTVFTIADYQIIGARIADLVADGGSDPHGIRMPS